MRHHLNGGGPARRAGLILLLLAAFTLVGTSASAYWTTSGSGNGSAATGTLDAPTNVAATNATGASTVSLTWTGSFGPTVPDGYYVTRIPNVGSPAPACATSPTSLTTSTLCTDPAVPDGTYRYTVTAVYHGWTAPSSSSNAVTIVTAKKLAFTTQPSASAASRIAFAVQPVVTVQDANGATVAADTSSVTLTLTNPAGATLSCTSNPKTVAAGLATFAGCNIDKAGTYTLTASDGTLTSATSSSVTIGAGAPARVTVASASPQSATVNTSFGTLAARVTDSFGNVVPGVSVTFTAPATGASGRFANNTVTTSAPTSGIGVATTTAFAANTTAGSYAVSATASGATSASFALTNNPRSAATIAIQAGSPQSATVNTAFATLLTARVTDSFGNAVPGVSVTFAAPSNGASGRFGPSNTLTTSATSNASGVATATALTANTTAGSYAVSATVPGATSASFTLTNNPGSVNKLVFTTVPSGNQPASNRARIGGYQVQRQDSFGNPVTAGSAVTVNLSTTSSAKTKFFSLTYGGRSGTAVTSVLIPSGASTSGTFYYADGNAGSPTLTAQAAGITNSATTSPTLV